METACKQEEYSESLANEIAMGSYEEHNELKMNNDGPPALLGSTRRASSSSVSSDVAPSATGAQDKEREGREMSFPSKLHKIMSNPEFRDIITWLPHGRAWKMLNRKAFEEKVIPRYFRHCRYASFMRQVNGWGFNRIARGPDTNAYYHEMFLRGMPELCENIRRPTEKPTMKTYALCVAQTPDFYSLGDVNPSTDSKKVPTPPAKETKLPAQKTTKPKKRRIITILPQNRKAVAKSAISPLARSSAQAMASGPSTISSSQQVQPLTQPQTGALAQQQMNNLLSVPSAAAGLLGSQPAAVSSLDILRLANAGTQPASNPLLSALRYPNSDATLRALAGTSVLQSNAASQALLLAQLTGGSPLLPAVPQQPNNLVNLLGGSAAVGNTGTSMCTVPSLVSGQASALRAVQQQRDALRQLLNSSSHGGAAGQR